MTAPRPPRLPRPITLPDVPVAIPPAERDETAPRRRGLLSSPTGGKPATVGSVIAAVRSARDAWREERA